MFIEWQMEWELLKFVHGFHIVEQRVILIYWKPEDEVLLSGFLALGKVFYTSTKAFTPAVADCQESESLCSSITLNILSKISCYLEQGHVI